MNNTTKEKDIEQIIRDMSTQNDDKKKYTTTQLRLLLSNAVIIKNKIEKENIDNSSEKVSSEIVNEIKYLLIKHVYQCGRDKGVKQFDQDFKISTRIKAIGDSKKKYQEFYRYLEEIVAYTKYYEKEEL